MDRYGNKINSNNTVDSEDMHGYLFLLHRTEYFKNMYNTNKIKFPVSVCVNNV